MKIKKEHYKHMLEAIRPLATEYLDIHRANLISEGKAKDVEKRLRWDLLYAARLTPFICDNLYQYLNDVHIDTALRYIIKDLEGESYGI